MIKINKDWSLESDESCVTLLKRRIIKDGVNKGNTSWDAKGYYNNFAEALKAMVDKDIQSNNSRLDYLIDRVKALKEHIDAVVPLLSRGGRERP